MESSLIRTPEPEAPAEPKVEKHETPTDRAVPDNKGEMPPGLFKEAGKDPYLCELLEVGEAYKHFNMKHMIDTIDSYLLDDTKTRDDYKTKLNKMVELSGAEETDIYDFVGRLHKWLEIDNKLKEAIREKEALMQKPIEEMSAHEIEEYLKEKYGKR